MIVEDSEDRWRGCDACHERVINLDVANVTTVVEQCKDRWPQVCIHASANSGKVIFLRDADAPPSSDFASRNEDGLVTIKTVRSIEDINRAVGIGYWPDVRFIEYDETHLRSKFSVGQNRATGRIETSGDYRHLFDSSNKGAGYSSHIEGQGDEWQEIIPFRTFYQYYQEVPVAAYLIPRDLADGASVIVEDPIEDIVGWRWNQGDTARAKNVRGRIDALRVILDKASAHISEVVG